MRLDYTQIDWELRIVMVGDLARLIGFASDPATQKPGVGINPGSTKLLVAGTSIATIPYSNIDLPLY